MLNCQQTSIENPLSINFKGLESILGSCFVRRPVFGVQEFVHGCEWFLTGTETLRVIDAGLLATGILKNHSRNGKYRTLTIVAQLLPFPGTKRSKRVEHA
jgi:hypothetical protein